MDLVVIEFKWGRGTFLALFLLLDMTSYSFVLQKNVKFSLVTSHNRAKFGADSKRGSQIIKRLHCLKSVRIQENTNHKKLRIWKLFTQCYSLTGLKEMSL